MYVCLYGCVQSEASGMTATELEWCLQKEKGRDDVGRGQMEQEGVSGVVAASRLTTQADVFVLY